MFTIDLEKELLRSKMGSTSKEEDIILTEADKLLKHTTQDDIKILNDLGLNHALKKSKMIKSKLSFPWERVFHRDEIKSLCVTYGLRFLDINKFKGEIDPLLPTKVKEFRALYEETTKDLSRLRLNNLGFHFNSWIHEKRAMDMYEEFSYHRFKICAPKESFKLSERPKDPLLFYPIGNDSYYLVHKWGNDISIWNALKAWKRRSVLNWFVYSNTTYHFPIFLLLKWVFDWNIGMFFSYLITWVFTLIAGYMCASKFEFHKDVWNDEYKD